ncbi:DegT/DnrJ/EryC1/StrS family aminotransferase [Halosegnis marinus]|uniref:DegT/DnrJ/EryC1/StrS family aminotransferase n=1 Tax=Halosegnis marinus TaxID=3034023 RepID=A0ABD5ZS72_9EURY|nr:DegT/DnrJ/EryC1/StrS family aminotransferase [Halosegnis sp. DT85]
MSRSEERPRVPIAAPDVGERARENVERVLASGSLAAGEEVEAFESTFAATHGVDHAVAVSNGTAALHVALHALGIGPGDTVVTTPFTFVATANAVRLCGATPVFADVDERTLNLDPDAAERAVREHDADALLVVHLYGLPARTDRFADIADDHDLALVEDAAQAHGAGVGGKPAGTVGDAGCFSFYPTKNMTTGEGGMVVTDRDDVAERARRFRNHGRATGGSSYEHVEVGHNFRMTDVAAALGRAQLDRLPRFVQARREHAAALTAALADTPLTLPPVRTGRRHAYHQYTVRTDDRDALREALDARGIDTGVYYPTPVHRQPAYDGWDGSYPNAERAAEEVLSLPVHPRLSGTDIDRVVAAVREVVADE